MNVEYRVLGPLEVLADGVPVAVPAGRCHVLLATLLLRPNRLVSVDELIDRGLSGELVAELRSLVAEHPLRESFWQHLMLALYRSGQQAEALRAYQDVREKLVDELGVDPGPALRELHQQILRAEV